MILRTKLMTTPPVMKWSLNWVVSRKTSVYLNVSRSIFDEYDDHNAILSVHAGAGGVDAQDWAEILARMYQRFLEESGFSVTVEDISEGEEAGVKSVTMTVRGEHAYGTLESERGIHRLVRISPFDAHPGGTRLSQVSTSCPSWQRMKGARSTPMICESTPTDHKVRVVNT